MSRSAGTRLAPPGFMTNGEEWQRKTVAYLAQAHQGRIDNTGMVTLAINVATTLLLDSRLSPLSYVGFMPTTANAATELATLRVTSQSIGGLTITHANAATGDRTFRFCILG